MRFKFLSHTADMKFQAFGKTLEKCFENSAYALKEVITSDKIKPLIKKEINVSGKDYENLLYNFLEEFLFLIDSSGFIVSKVEKIIIKNVKGKYMLNAIVYGDNIKKYKTTTDIKAITYNDMFVRFDEKKKQYVLQVVVDV